MDLDQLDYHTNTVDPSFKDLVVLLTSYLLPRLMLQSVTASDLGTCLARLW
jgi:hypothetical protein